MTNEHHVDSDGSPGADVVPVGHRSTARTVARAIALLLLAVIVGVGVFVERSQPPTPGSFYEPPKPLSDGPLGTIVKSEPIQGFPDWITGWKLLYRTTSYTGAPAVASAMVLVPRTPAPPGGRRVVAWAHPTTGVVPACAPSLQNGDSLTKVQGYNTFLSAGYAVVATDYQGLGTPGPHPYLVGLSEGHNVLDSVRAARLQPGVDAGSTFAVWGHSQGGQASLFAGELAATYAPELTLVGVAAAAPATELASLFRRDIGTLGGDGLASMAVVSWTAIYPDLTMDQVIQPSKQSAVRRVANNCIETTGQLFESLPDLLLLRDGYLAANPWDIEPWKTRLAENTPGATKIGVPIFVTQGLADTLVWPEVTRTYVDGRCTAGETITFRGYPGVTHTQIGVQSASDVAAWINDRFDGKPADRTCPAPT